MSLDQKDTCLRLLASESEAAALAVIASVPEMNDPKNWKPLDGRETNFNVTSNQASDGGKALTELMTNMVDAVLMKAARQKGIDPKASSAPQTMYAAVDQLIKNLHGGKLVNLDHKDPWLKDFAQKNLAIGISGAKSKAEGLPCYTFVDNGEGQQPDDFEDTFLSLSAGHKKSIPFVQGKFNMGSSGVLRYCGRHWLKLIVSRRFDGTGDWGWTVMRRRPGHKEELPVAEFFVLPSGAIPRFSAQGLYPFQTAAGKRYDGVHLETGTVVKLFDYQVGSKFPSFKGSREALNENLVETILPFRILDLRQKPDSKRTGDRAIGVDPRAFYGMEFLLLNSHREDDVDDEDDAAGTGKIFVGKLTDPDLGEVSISAIALKRDLPGWLKPSSSNNRVFHAVNGQVQFKQTRGYLSQSCGFPALKDRVVIIVDASALTFSAHNEVWKGDREHISNTIDGERYKELVTKTIRGSETLKDLQQKVAREELERASKAESNSLFQQLVDKDPTLAGLLSSRDPTIKMPAAGGNGGGDSGAESFEGLYSPTFVRFEEKFKGGLSLPIGGGRPVSARTDAENGYLQRSDNPGRVFLDPALRDKFQIREHLRGGKLTLFFTPVEGKVEEGQAYTLKLGLHDAAMPKPVETQEIVLTITSAVVVEDDERERKKPNPKGGDGKDKPGSGQDAPTHGLPSCMLLTRDGREVQGYQVEQWPDDFTETDGGVIVDLGDGQSLYKVNYDNAYHLKYRLGQAGTVAREVITEKYILGMRITLLGYEHALRALQDSKSKSKSPDAGGIAEFADDFRRMAARGAASTVLALAENLPKIVDATSVQGDVE